MTVEEKSLSVEIQQIMEDMIQGNELGIFGQEEATDTILKRIEKRIEQIKEDEIKNVVGLDDATEQQADNINDIPTEKYWKGAKFTINKIKEMLNQR